MIRFGVSFGGFVHEKARKFRSFLFSCGLGSGKGFILPSSSAPGLQDMKDIGTMKNGSLSFTYAQNEYVVSKTQVSGTGTMKNGSLRFAYAFDGSDTVYL